MKEENFLSEIKLANAVLNLAIKDMVWDVRHGVKGSAAYKFILSDLQGWTNIREFWCDVAGIDPGVFKERAYMKLNGSRGDD